MMLTLPEKHYHKGFMSKNKTTIFIIITFLENEGNKLQIKLIYPLYLCKKSYFPKTSIYKVQNYIIKHIKSSCFYIGKFSYPY